MTLGDIRRAGGDQVFFDIGAAQNNPNSIPLLVTLPPAAKVPVKIIG
ncbi:AvrPphF family type III effector [Ralstonia syzygii]